MTLQHPRLHMKKSIILIGFFALILSCKTGKKPVTYETETLKIKQLTPHTYQHITYLQTESFGKVACNGLIVANNGEAIIFDTPNTELESEELIQWVQSQLDCQIKGIVATHFHTDCLGGLKAFHNRNIPSYAYTKTIDLAS